MIVHYIHRQYSIYLLLLFVCNYSLYSQDITGKIIDQETQEPIPYVSIILNETDGGISNDEGDFSITIPRHTLKNDSVYFSSIGYKTKAILIRKLKNTTISLAPEVLELSSVYLSGEKLTADEIIDKLKDNIAKNYNTNSTKNRFFMRESFNQYYKKLTFDFKKSTIKGISKKLIDSMVNSIPKRTAYHNETLGDYYSNFERFGYFIFRQK